MDFNLTREEQMIRDSAREFCRSEIEPIAGDLDRAGRVPEELLKQLSKLGFFGITVPEAFGGEGAGDFAHLLVIEELAYAGCPAWWPVAFNNSLPQTICRYGTDEQKETYVRNRLDGSQLYSIQFTEPDTGSDPNALQTTARETEDGFLINGSKRFSTFGARSGPALVWANVEGRGCTCFLIEKQCPGYTAPKIWELMGSGGIEPADVYYQDMAVKENQVLGEVGKGFGILLHWIAVEKIQGCIVAVALAQAALDEAVAYARRRRAGKGTMASMQGIRFELAQIYANIQACRWMTYRTMHLLAEDSKAFQTEAAACKIAVQPLMSEAISAAFRLHGGYAYTKEHKIERLFRAQPGNVVISVSLEINKSIVGASLVK